jgi:hypothetical protein
MTRFKACKRLYSQTHRIYFLPGDTFDLDTRGHEQEISDLVSLGTLEPCVEAVPQKVKPAKEDEVKDGSD